MISKAKAANMPKDKIDAAIKRGVDGKDGANCFCFLSIDGERMRPLAPDSYGVLVFAGANAETVLYEGSGPGGSAFIVRDCSPLR